MVSTQQVRTLWAARSLMLVAVIVGSVALIVSTREASQRQHDLCRLVAVFTDPSQAPPTSTRGAQQAAALRTYQARNCPPPTPQ